MTCIPEVKFTNILRADFSLIFLRQKTSFYLLKLQAQKDAIETFVQKKLHKNVGEIDP